MVTQADIDKLKRLLWSGERSVTVDGDQVTSQSPDEIRRTIREMEAELAGQAASPLVDLQRRRTLLASDRDLGGAPADPRFEWNR